MILTKSSECIFSIIEWHLCTCVSVCNYIKQQSPLFIKTVNVLIKHCVQCVRFFFASSLHWFIVISSVLRLTDNYIENSIRKSLRLLVLILFVVVAAVVASAVGFCKMKRKKKSIRVVSACVVFSSFNGLGSFAIVALRYISKITIMDNHWRSDNIHNSVH